MKQTAKVEPQEWHVICQQSVCWQRCWYGSRNRRYTLNTLLPTNNTVSIIKSKLKIIQALLKAHIESRIIYVKALLTSESPCYFRTFLYSSIVIVVIEFEIVVEIKMLWFPQLKKDTFYKIFIDEYMSEDGDE